jgi:hypothetical protein
MPTDFECLYTSVKTFQMLPESNWVGVGWASLDAVGPKKKVLPLLGIELRPLSASLCRLSYSGPEDQTYRQFFWVI